MYSHKYSDPERQTTYTWKRILRPDMKQGHPERIFRMSLSTDMQTNYLIPNSPRFSANSRASSRRIGRYPRSS